MLRLRTLGGLSVEGASHPLTGAAVQRRRLGLLAVIAAGDTRGVSRDRLLGLFWPERDEERARHALAQSIYALRRALGEDALVVGQNELRLNAAVIGVDLWDFDRALAEGRIRDAAESYAGPFLDGVFIEGAPELDRWIEVERDRLRRAYIAALVSLASAADGESRYDDAVRWWRLLTIAEPLAPQPALGMMRALAATGDIPAALEHGRSYEARLHSELELSPSSEIVALTEWLRDQPVAVSQAARPIATPAFTPVTQPPATTSSGAERSWRRSRTGFALAAGCAALVALVALTRTNLSRASALAVDRNRIAVFPFTARGDTANAFLGVGSVEVLSAALNGAGPLRAVDPRALLIRLGSDSISDPSRAARIAADLAAGQFVLGSLTQLDDSLQVTASLYDVTKPGRPVAQASSIGARTDVLQTLQRLAAELLVGRSDAPSQRLARVAAVTTTSIPALKEYITGESAMRVWNFGDALDAFQRAVALDTTFALGYYRLSIAADWMGRGDLVAGAATQAARHADRLSERDRQLVEALLAWRRHDSDEAERRYREILLHYPDDVETWYQLGEVYFHDNPARGRSFADARMPFERALALDPNGKEIMVHLMRIAAWEERWDSVGAFVRRMDPAGTDPHLRPYRMVATGDTAGLTRALESLRPVDGTSVFISGVRFALYTHRLDVAAHLFELLTDQRRPPGERAAGHHALGFLAAARGRWREARARLDSARALRAHYGLAEWSRLALVPFAALPPNELAALRDTLLRWRSVPVDTSTRKALWESSAEEYPVELTAIAGMISARLNDAAGVGSAARALEEMAWPRTPGLDEWRAERVALLRAAALRLSGRSAAALAEAPHVGVPDDRDVRDDERYMVAELASAAGQLAEAVQLFGSFEQTGVQSLPWAAPGHFARGELLERTGKTREAALEYERVVELWRDCDVELEPLRNEAARRAARLSSR